MGGRVPDYDCLARKADTVDAAVPWVDKSIEVRGRDQRRRAVC